MVIWAVHWVSAGGRGGSRGGSLGSNEPPFLLIHSTYWFFVTRPAVFDTQRWRASPVWLLYDLLRAIQFNVHALCSAIFLFSSARVSIKMSVVWLNWAWSPFFLINWTAR